MGIFIAWIILSLIVATIGQNRKIGYLKTFILCLLLSPIIGALFAIASERITKETMQNEINKRKYKQSEQLCNKAFKDFKKKDFKTAATNFHEALRIYPNDKIICFNLAACYSELQDIEKGFYFLDKAVENGYCNFKKIEEHKSFRILRSNQDYNAFVKNGYRKVATLSDNSNNGKIDNLERLSQLKDKGILTEQEFEIEKNKILSEN